MSDVIKNVFVSHHHKDDASVDGLANILSSKGYQIRNSSIRVKPENQQRLDQKRISDRTIERLLRMKMRWASQVIVVIGKETHTRSWVDWEIKVAHQLGKPIIGVFENGLKDQVKIPKNLEKYATSRVGWRADSIIDALSGNSQFQEPDGSPSPKKLNGVNTVC
ncbi:TIR domain-containing protein [Cellvibrio sp. BR]|uniref:TIR domain-containing protein n=1 Tax=Cellvibrio sp. BR TaxID=1134474 RepID=UPI001E42AFFD|nr:TIR domain-containing protein [Cellvibrio sp. BR]